MTDNNFDVNEDIERITGRSLNAKWEVNASHALYREDGKWYHMLRQFPGALFDRNGYILFQSQDDFLSSPGVDANPDTDQVHIPLGISHLPGYVNRSDVVLDDSDTGDSFDQREDSGESYFDQNYTEIDIREDNHSVFEWVRKYERGLIVTVQLH